MDGRIVQWIQNKYQGLHDELSEFTRRRWAAVEAASLGRGGISAVSAATGLAHSTIRRGIRDLNAGSALVGGRQRRQGAGRKRIDVSDPHVRVSLERLVKPESRGESAIAVAVDLQEYPTVGARTDISGTPRGADYRATVPQGGWL